MTLESTNGWVARDEQRHKLDDHADLIRGEMWNGDEYRAGYEYLIGLTESAEDDEVVIRRLVAIDHAKDAWLMQQAGAS